MNTTNNGTNGATNGTTTTEETPVDLNGIRSAFEALEDADRRLAAANNDGDAAIEEQVAKLKEQIKALRAQQKGSTPEAEQAKADRQTALTALYGLIPGNVKRVSRGGRLLIVTKAGKGGGFLVRGMDDNGALSL